MPLGEGAWGGVRELAGDWRVQEWVQQDTVQNLIVIGMFYINYRYTRWTALTHSIFVKFIM